MSDLIKLNKKVVIVINGKGGSGKSTLCQAAAKKFRVMEADSVGPVKEAAKKLGWSGGKDLRDRNMLHDLKNLSIAYNEGPTIHLAREFHKFKTMAFVDILFVHIREAEEIEKFRKVVDIPFYVFLVESEDTVESEYGNDGDDQVDRCKYDIRVVNKKMGIQSDTAFVNFLSYFLSKEGFEIKGGCDMCVFRSARTVKIGKVYRHFKGHKVLTMDIAQNTETGEDMVIYKHLGDGKLYVRPKNMFLSEVDREKYPDVDQFYRFEEV